MCLFTWAEIGDHVVPQDVTQVIIDRSVSIIQRGAFFQRTKLVSVETHEGIESVEMNAFNSCCRLRKINLIGVREVERAAFHSCSALTDVEFGDKLETIGDDAFNFCISLQKLTMPSVRIIEAGAFAECAQLTEAEFGGNLETIQQQAFYTCPSLRRIVIPLKDDMIPEHVVQHRCSQFDRCPNLTTVDLVGGIHNTVSCLLLAP
ncbi:leucine-rich repeat domain-containing protein [Skeletonema marinoi]|uniref:Leucine-rich repeat domain-containing protein n=1 Tax=Skeletonema marinoi TaxID=267567 RepID=A0AAD8Y2A9_9STRA|nr:leucine-rich repeat domain-containing protein [Skeletonema marinoi]